MPRGSEPRKTEQLNVRLPSDIAAALAAIEFVDNVTPQDYVRGLIEADLLIRSRTDPLFSRAYRLRREALLRETGTLSTLPLADEST